MEDLFGKELKPWQRSEKAGDRLIRQRTDGRWRGSVCRRLTMITATRKQRLSSARASANARKAGGAQKAQLGGIPSDKLRPEMRLPTGWITGIETHCKPNIRTSTQSGYEPHPPASSSPELGEIPLNRLTQERPTAVLRAAEKGGRKTRTEYYGEGLSDRMVRMYHATCRSALQRAVQDGLIRTNPAEGCKLPPKKAREMQVLARDELQRFLDFRRKPRGYYGLFLLDLGQACGAASCWRCNGTTSIWKRASSRSAKQVSLVRGKIVMSVPKTKNSIRKLVLPPAVVQVLREYPQQPPLH